MNDYRQIRINIFPCSEDATDLMAAMLADIDYESFVPDNEGITAYVPVTSYNREALDDVIASWPMQSAVKLEIDIVVEGRDWNAEWERNYFQPIVVGNRCVVHSSFHTDVPSADYDIVIDPRMAFGTGHHATTSQVMQALLSLDLKGKSVIDMGTGTAILAILAAMHGAGKVTGIEIDSFAYENAVENCRLNGHSEITLINGDASALEGIEPADVFVANINRNIITADLAAYVKALKPGGTMLLSGFYESDIPVIMEVAAPLDLMEISHTVEGDNWTCLRLALAIPF